METKFVRFHYGNTAKLIVLYTGIHEKELSGLIQAVFHIPKEQEIIGFESPNSEIIPISVACRFPQMLGLYIYRVIVKTFESTETKLNEFKNKKQVNKQLSTNKKLKKESTNSMNGSSNSSPIVDSIFGFVSALATEGYINEFERQSFETLLLTTPMHAGIMKAFNEFGQTNDIMKFKDSMIQIIRPSAMESALDQISSMVDSIYKVGSLTEHEVQVLKTLLLEKDSVIVAVFHVVQSIGDLSIMHSCLLLLARFYHEISIEERRSMGDLLNVLQALVDGNSLTPEQGTTMMKLILSRHEIIRAAYEAYESDNDIEELMDTLIRISKSYQISNVESATIPSVNRSAAISPGSKNVPRPSAPTPEADSIQMTLRRLHKNGDLPTNDLLSLTNLVSEENEFVIGAFEVYQIDGDKDELIDTLSRISKLEKQRKTLLRQKEKDSIQQSDESMKGNQLPNVIKLLRSWEKTNVLTSDEANALVQLCEVGHGLIVAAIEAYQADHDEKELVDTFKQISKHVQRKNLYVEGKSIPIHSQGSSFQQTFERCLRKGPFTAEAIKILHEHYKNGTPILFAAYEVYELEQNEDDFIDSMLRIAKNSKNQGLGNVNTLKLSDSARQLLYVVTNQMKEEGALSEEAAAVLNELINQGNAVMLAAYESYEADDDIGELIETLLLIAKNASAMVSVKEPITDIVVEEDQPAKYSKRFILRIINMFAAKNLITEDDWKVLVQLLDEDNPSLFAAFDVYAQDHSTEELLDTLRRILALLQCRVAIGYAEEVPNSSKDSSNPDIQKELLSIVSSFEENQILRLRDAQLLRRLIKNSDDRVMAAYTVYSSDQDTAEFIDTILRIVKLSQAYDIASDSDEMDETLDVNDRVSIRQVIDDICEAYSMSSSEHRILRRLADEDDPRILGALDASEGLNDLSELADSFQRICRLHQEKAKATSYVYPQEKVLNLLNGLNLSSEEQKTIRQAIGQDEPICMAALDVYELENNKDDLEDTLQRFARYHQSILSSNTNSHEKNNTENTNESNPITEDAHNFLINELTNQMVSMEVIHPTQQTIILKKWNIKDPRVLAALDIFDMNEDMKELINSLRELAK